MVKVKKNKIVVILTMILVYIMLLSTVSVEAASKYGWVKSGTHVMYRFSNGKIAKNEIMLDKYKKKYLFDSNGYNVCGQTQYYSGMAINSAGEITSTNNAKWKKVGTGYKFYTNAGTYLKNTSAIIDGVTYYFDSTGYVLVRKGGVRIKNSGKSSNGKTYTIVSKSVNYPMYLVNYDTKSQKIWSTQPALKYTTNVLKAK